MIPQPYLVDPKRVAFLASRLKPHVRDDYSIIDLGCGSGLFAGHFKENPYTGIDSNKEAIKSCLKQFPDATWVLGTMKAIPKTTYDVVIHTGIPSVSYNAWQVHKKLMPRFVLLEAGYCMHGGSDTVKGFDKILNIYVDNGYLEIDRGWFVMDSPVPDRWYKVLVYDMD